MTGRARQRPARWIAVALAALIGGSALANPPVPPRPETVAALQKFTRNACVPRTASVLDAVGIGGTQVKSLSYYASGGSADIRATVNRLDAYVGLTDQPGSIVIHHDAADCAVITVYSSGGAKLPRAYPR